VNRDNTDNHPTNDRLLKVKNPETLEDMIDYRLYLVYRDCGHVTEKVCKTEYGINRRRLRIIFCLMYCEGVTVSELAKTAELDMAQTSRTIGTMMREGYLKRLSNPENARYAKVVLTDKGRQIYKNILGRYRSINQALLQPFTDEEIITLDYLMSKLRISSQELQQTFIQQPTE